MRVIMTLLWLLILLWLCSMNWAAEPAQPATLTHESGPAKGWPHTVRGLGLTAADARNNAYDEARKAITGWMLRQQPPMRSWQPTRTTIEDNLVDDEQAGANIKLDNLGVAKSWVIHLLDPDVAELRRLDGEAALVQREIARKERAQVRLLVAGKIMAVMLGLLVMLFAGSRLLEKMQPRYARLVVAGIIGITACIVLGMFVF